MSFATRFLKPVTPTERIIEENFDEPITEPSHSEAVFDPSAPNGIKGVRLILADDETTAEDAKMPNNSDEGELTKKALPLETEDTKIYDTNNKKSVIPEEGTSEKESLTEEISLIMSEDDTNSAPAKPVKPDIRSYFAEKGFEIDVSGKKEVIPAVENLAFGIALNFDATAPFIRYIRESISKKHFENATYYYGAETSAEKNAIVQLAEKLSDCGILSDVYVNKANNTIRMKISSAPKVINFLSGDFLEMFGHSVVKDVLKKFEKEEGYETELYTNAIIKKGDQQNELDLVFRVADEVFWAEIKSGKFDPDTYRLLGEHMGVVPDKLILLAGNKNDDQTEVIGYLYDFFVTPK